MLFSAITAILFGAFGFLFSFINPFFEFYKTIALYSFFAASACLVLWFIRALFGRRLSSGSGGGALDEFFTEIPWFRMMLLSLVVSLSLFWIHSLVFPIGFTVFLVSLLMFLARFIFVIFG
jgi:hypothetical protein